MNELCHYGIMGQKWGRRRFQNDDGTYTEEGKKRYFGAHRYEKRLEDVNSGKIGPVEESNRTYKIKKELYDTSREIARLEQETKKLREKMENTKVDLIKSSYRDEYLSGRDFASKALIKLSGSDKGYADYVYNLESESR